MAETIEDLQSEGRVGEMNASQKGKRVEIVVETPPDGRVHVVTYTLTGDPPAGPPTDGPGGVRGEVMYSGHSADPEYPDPGTNRQYIDAERAAASAVRDMSYRIVDPSPILAT